MEITQIVPLLQEATGYRRFELELDSGAFVFVDSSELLRYARVQQEILRAVGKVFLHEPAEERGGTSKWQAHIATLLQDEVVIPNYEVDRYGLRRYIYNLDRWRTEHRESEAVSA